LSLSGGMLLILPEVWSVGVVLSLCIYYGYLQSRNSIKFSYHLIKKTFYAIFAVLFGKMLLFAYLAGTPIAFKYVLAEKILGETNLNKYSFENGFAYITILFILWAVLSKKVSRIIPLLVSISLIGVSSKYLPFQLWVNLLFAITCMSIFYIGANPSLLRFKKGKTKE
jgi:hypothetical protein